MKIISRVNSKQILDKIISLSDVVILGTKFSLATPAEFEILEIEKIRLNSDVEIFVEVDKIIHENELNDIFDFLKQIEKIGNVGILYQDLAILNYVLENEFDICLCYDPKTYLTSSKQIDFYSSFGVKNQVLSRELTLREIKTILANVTNINHVWMLGYGLTQMLHSKRNLIKNFVDYKINVLGKNLTLNLDKISLYDEERKQNYPVIIYKEQTFIMSPQTLNVLEDIIKLNNYGLKNILLDFSSQNEQTTIYVLETYNKIQSLLNQNNLVEVKKVIQNSIDEINLKSHNKTGYGLLYKKTMYKI